MGLLTGKDSPRYSQYTADQFVGNGSQTAFTLSRNPPTASSIIVTVDGVKQHTITYNLNSSGVLTFSEAPPSGCAIEVVHVGTQGQSIVPTDNSVSTSKLVNGAVINTKLDSGNLDGTGAMMIPYGTTAQRPATPVGGYTRYNTDIGVVESYHGAVKGWVALSNIFSAQGGLETTYVNGGVTYKVHTFNSSGTFTVLSGSAPLDFLIVAGGGGGGTNAGAGGGAGGLIYQSGQTFTPGNYNVVVGAGGSGGGTDASPAGNGSNSSFLSFTAIGGGGGINSNGKGAAGGSGGGSSVAQTGGAGTAGQGNKGGDGNGNDGAQRAGGGGGGAGAVGQNVQSDTMAGQGGNGLQYNMNGTATYYAGGGGGASHTGGLIRSGGLGGGGNSGLSNMTSGGTAGQAGAANTGGGGGAGSGGGFSGASGGSGVVIIRYPL